MSHQETAKSITLPTWDGSQTTYALCRRRFVAYALIKQYRSVLLKGAKEFLPSSIEVEVDESTESGKRQAKYRDWNAQVISALTCSFTKEATMNKIDKSSSAAWPDVLANHVIEILDDEMMPKDMTSKVELRLQLASVKLGKDEDPTALGDKLSIIQARFTAAGLYIDEDDLLAAAINAAHDKYSGTIAQVQ